MPPLAKTASGPDEWFVVGGRGSAIAKRAVFNFRANE
jgi:hypothetical protein